MLPNTYTSNRQITHDLCLIFIGCLGLFLWNNYDLEFVNFQTRFAVFAQEMLRNGPSFFPTIYDTPYPDYPATSTFLIYLASWPIQEVTRLTLVLPTALASTGVALITYRIGAIYSRDLGRYAVLCLLFCASFLAESRTVALDQFVSLVTVSSFYLAFSSDQKPKRLLGLPILFVLGFSIRGPIGMIVPASVVGGYFLLEKQFKRLGLLSVTTLLLLCLCSGTMLLLAYLTGGEQFLDYVIWMQATSRVRVHTENPWAGYFINCLADYAILYPLALLVALGLTPMLWKNFSQTLKSDNAQRLIPHMIFWTLIILIGFGFANSKRNHYVLPMVPPLALIAAYLLSSDASKLNRFLRYLKKGFLGLCKILPSLFIVALLGAWAYAQHIHFNIEAPIIPVLCFSFILQIAVLFLSQNTSEKRNDGISFIGGLLTFIILHIFIIEPTNLSLNHTRDFVHRFEWIRHANKAGLGFYDFGYDAGAIKFMSNLPPREIAQGVKPIFIPDLAELFSTQEKMYFITTPEIFSNLPPDKKALLTELGRAEIGHIDILIFGITEYLEENDKHAFRG